MDHDPGAGKNAAVTALFARGTEERMGTAHDVPAPYRIEGLEPLTPQPTGSLPATGWDYSKWT